jgi:hypothetical protein
VQVLEVILNKIEGALHSMQADPLKKGRVLGHPTALVEFNGKEVSFVSKVLILPT